MLFCHRCERRFNGSSASRSMDAWLDDAVDRVSKYAYGGSSPGYHVVPKTSGAVRLLPFYNSGVVGFSGVNFALKVAVRIFLFRTIYVWAISLMTSCFFMITGCAQEAFKHCGARRRDRASPCALFVLVRARARYFDRAERRDVRGALRGNVGGFSVGVRAAYERVGSVGRQRSRG